jgi:hypothetical protein
VVNSAEPSDRLPDGRGEPYGLPRVFRHGSAGHEKPCSSSRVHPGQRSLTILDARTALRMLFLVIQSLDD